MCDEDCSTSFVHGTVRTSSFIHPPLLVDVRQMSNAMMINIWYISCSFPLSYVRIPVGVVVRISSIVVTVVVIRIVAFVVIVGSCSAYSSKSSLLLLVDVCKMSNVMMIMRMTHHPRRPRPMSLHEETVLRCLLPLPLLCTISRYRRCHCRSCRCYRSLQTRCVCTVYRRNDCPAMMMAVCVHDCIHRSYSFFL